MDPNENENQDKKLQVGRWSQDEHSRFLYGITIHGKDWKKVEEVVGTRSGSQVRSHAQKFFNKLKKQEKKKGGVRKKQNEPEAQVSDSQNSFMRGIGDDVSNTTPLQLVSLIKKQSEGGQKVNIKKLKKKLQDQMVIAQRQQQQQNQNDKDSQLLANIKRHNSYKSLSNFLSAYENMKDSSHNQYQDESFLINITKNYKKYFQQGGSFENLIDFGNPHHLIAAHHSIRKRSFTLPQGVEGDQQDLNERKKKLLTQNDVAQIPQITRDAYRQAILKQKDRNQKQKIDKVQNEGNQKIGISVQQPKQQKEQEPLPQQH